MKLISKANLEEPSTAERGIGTPLLVVLIIAALIGGTALGWGIARLDSSGDGSTTVSKSEFHQSQKKVNLLENNSASSSLSSALVDNLWPVDEIYRFAKKSVVEIKVLKTTKGLFEGRTQRGLGSGFVYDSSGRIVTNQHVVEVAEKILVKFHNGETVRAEMVGSDSYSDLAVLKVDPTGLGTELVPLELGSSSSLETGDRVVAVGNPFGLKGTATFGIVSQTGRVLSSGTRYLIPGVIQIDAPINPGNSGGPLLSLSGKIVGITSAIKSQTGTFSGIGYAVPSDLLKRVVPSLIEKGEYEYAWLGISGKKVTYQIAQERGLERTRGFLVESVREEGPSIGKVKKDDIILEIDGKEVTGPGDILSYLALEKSPGENVSLKILRGGDRKTVTVELGTRPSPQWLDPKEILIDVQTDGRAKIVDRGTDTGSQRVKTAIHLRRNVFSRVTLLTTKPVFRDQGLTSKFHNW